MALLDFLATNSVALVVFCSLLGLLVGSFLNVVAHRYPIMMQRMWIAECSTLLDSPPHHADEPFNLLAPRSRCPSCNHLITALENIPVISYMVLRGRCRQCRTPISIQYPFVELFGGLVAGIAAWRFGFTPAAGAAMLLAWTLITLTVIDFREQLLPDSLTLPLLWSGLLQALFALHTDLQSAVIGAMLGYLSLWSVYHLFRLLTGKEGMGYGDFKLLAALGAWCGWQGLIPIVLISSLVGAVIGIVLVLVKGRDKNVPMPFGPFLAIAGWIVFTFEPWIARYWSI